MIKFSSKFIWIFFVLLVSSCSCFYESEFDKEKQIIDNYHRQLLMDAGKLFFFIPQKEIANLYPSLDTVMNCDARQGDKVLFFDSDGNIVYQCKIYSNKKDCAIKIRCLNLNSGEYYISSLSMNNIKGFSNDEFSHFLIISSSNQ
ncbi:MAG: hypothetical protein HN704_04535 [Bacteroidetes bacterium]|jgi:hypothetical protein|nr:hypothetical protein [Bacteroidota bacterium]MBT6685978.1 hypothetical protein [Bacteroidota bacterium]MBT7144422.1 hypothetical protein [Bacteroidota bacterium]MBT7490859.1 hypothetical protein [Bacteroidota bacterium]